MSTLNVGTIKSISSAAPVFQNTSGTEKGQLAKAWCHVSVSGGTPSFDDSFGFSSITDVQAGLFKFHFTNAMSNNDYSAISTAEVGASNITVPVTTAQTTTEVPFVYYRITNFIGGGVATDPPALGVAVFGDN